MPVLGPETDNLDADIDATHAHTFALALIFLLRTDNAILVREKKQQQDTLQEVDEVVVRGASLAALNRVGL